MKTGLLKGTPIAIPGGVCDIYILKVNDIIHTMSRSTGCIIDGRISDIYTAFIDSIVEIECYDTLLKLGTDQYINTDRGKVKAGSITDNDIALGMDKDQQVCELPVISTKKYDVLAPVINIKIMDESGFYAKGLHILAN